MSPLPLVSLPHYTWSVALGDNIGACFVDSQARNVVTHPTAQCVQSIRSCLLSFLHHPYVPLRNLKNFISIDHPREKLH